MKRTAALSLLCTLSLFLSLAQGKKLKVITESANIHIEPSKSSTVIERLRKGTSLTLFGSGSEQKNWYYVSFYSEEKYTTITGFVQASQVELVAGTPQKAKSPEKKPNHDLAFLPARQQLRRAVSV